MNTIITASSSGLASLMVELLVATGVMLVLLLLMLSMKYELRYRRRKAARRAPMSTDDFLAGLDAGAFYDALGASVRAEVASQTQLPVDVIYPDDTMEFLDTLAGGNLDTAEIIHAIETGLEMPIPEEIASKIPYPHKGFRTSNTTLADCIKGFLECEEFTEMLSGDEPSC
ncbi:MAG: hypothetical protein HN350_01865 [Phycisphaerales bacterium]|nr:hypothetical protein [Phycisphaerales bacterium]